MFEIDARLAIAPPVDPLKGAPPPGSWVLWHGPKAQGVIELARKSGRPLTMDRVPPLPSDYHPPCNPTRAWCVEYNGRHYVAMEDVHDGFRGCYLFGGMGTEDE